MSESRLLELDPPQTPAEPIDTAPATTPTNIPAGSDELQPEDGPSCEKCGTAMGDSQVSYCLSCGYYPSMGTYVEIDPWEKKLAEGGVQETPSVSPMQVWMDLIPVWGWKLIACHALVVAMSVAVRFLNPAEGIFRMVWSLSQLFIGFMVFFVCHLLAYLSAIEEDADYSLVDFLLKPIKVWMPTIRRLPASFRQLAVGTCGLTAVLMSFLVIGALPYHVLWDWGIKEPPKKNLVKAIISQAMKAEGDENGLDGAIDDFAGDTEAGPAQGIPKVPREDVDCLVVGYTLTRDGNDLASLVLAREFRGKLIVVGRVACGLEIELRREFFQKLKLIARPNSFVPTTIIAHWVNPVFTCRVTCRGKRTSGRLIDVQLDSILGEIDYSRQK